MTFIDIYQALKENTNRIANNAAERLKIEKPIVEVVYGATTNDCCEPELIIHCTDKCDDDCVASIFEKIVVIVDEDYIVSGDIPVWIRFYDRSPMTSIRLDDLLSFLEWIDECVINTEGTPRIYTK